MKLGEIRKQHNTEARQRKRREPDPFVRAADRLLYDLLEAQASLSAPLTASPGSQGLRLSEQCRCGSSEWRSHCLDPVPNGHGCRGQIWIDVCARCGLERILAERKAPPARKRSKEVRRIPLGFVLRVDELGSDEMRLRAAGLDDAEIVAWAAYLLGWEPVLQREVDDDGLRSDDEGDLLRGEDAGDAVRRIAIARIAAVLERRHPALGPWTPDALHDRVEAAREKMAAYLREQRAEDEEEPTRGLRPQRWGGGPSA